ncbi:MAG TPA: amidohydrolase family protein [Gemmatimonadota bacterium]|nr:amidohydrolase family protein [Gemmatimonadota bacterium]
MSRRIAAAAGPLLVAALAALAAPGAAQDLAIVGGTVHPVSGPPIENATVLVQNGRIVAVGADVSVPAGAARIDAAGRVVTPGLFDPASSVGLVEVDLVSQTRDESATTADDPIAAAFDPLDGLNPNSVLVPYLRTYGLTTTATRPTGGLISGMGAVIDLAGHRAADMVARPRAAMFASFDEGTFRQVGGARGATALRLREVLDDARFWQRNRGAFDRGESRDLAASRLDLEALQPVLDGRMPLVVEADRASDILAVLRIASEFGVRPVILGGAEAWVVAGELAAGGVPVIVKPLTSLPSAFERLGARFDNAALLAAAGVPVAIGVLDTHRSHAITQEAGNAVRHGLPWDAALRAITLTPAEIYGVADRYGSIEPGKVANLVVWSGDPLELSTRAETVVIRGEVMPMTSRPHELFDRYRSLDDTPRPAFDVD